ncbi:hypothetical protein [Microbulbifer sp. TYP-18]|uniref:hypothetical protein n=1 Tax=Microbulbifer sp. TYP-18 TaxID=3230024 RepID=UPI0034C5F453
MRQSQAVLLLLIFLCARGLVPAGFMPAPVSGGAPYDFCHGDSRSALLLQWLADQRHTHQGHESGHQHDALTAHTFADNHCSFAAGPAALAGEPGALLPFAVRTVDAVPFEGRFYPLAQAFLLPLSRAPPVLPLA